MISKNQRKIIQKLQQKKFRNELGLFLVEGKKNISEFLQSDFEVETIFCVENHWKELAQTKINFISEDELKSVSLLKNPDDGIGIFKIPVQKKKLNSSLILVLDSLQDPGNLGTIIRLCDWFNIRQIMCSCQTVDCYNPKVVQATMGSLSRVSVEYTDILSFLQQTELPIFAATLGGENVYKTQLPQSAILVMGNEANGISNEVLKCCQNRITIPQFGNFTAESLNVAVATAILISEFRR